MNPALLIAAGLLAGAIDSIAGGGGLVTLPVLTIAVGAGAGAIGSNKIVGTMGALIALIVYARAGHFEWKRSLVFSACICIGSFCGSRLTPLIPLNLFPWLLAMTCPVILWVVWRKDLWVSRELKERKSMGSRSLREVLDPKICASGLLVGFYDGGWGPGGGTFMFLALLFAADMPLLQALAASKFANTVSASTALVSFSMQGYVHWVEGTWVAIGTGIGAFFGARFATKNAAHAVRPVLAIVVALLIARLLW